jgi:hypothetical protein
MFDDERARVPLAVVGVLLLVGATAFAATVETRGAARTDHRAEAALERVTAESATALRGAVARAARAAGTDPVTATADTAYGRVLDDSAPFRDYLRVRIYLAARDALDRTVHHTGPLRATASIPAVSTPAALERATRRIDVRAHANGTALHVRLRNVTVAVARGDRHLVRENRTLAVTVATPVLAMHDRTAAFERRLNRSAVDGPGLARRLTARLYPVVWARGYAQYAGAPVENVLANRHVAVSTNGAVLGVQRSVFGRSDPDGRTGLRRASLRVGVRDLLGPAPASSAEWAVSVLPDPNAPRPEAGTLDALATDARVENGTARPNRTVDVEIGTSADEALVSLVEGTDGASFADVTAAAYRVDIALETATDQIHDGTRPAADAPATGASLTRTETESSTTVRRRDGPTPATPAGWRRFATFTRRVTVTHTVTRTWRVGNTTSTTTANWTDRYRVGVSVVGRPAASRAPELPVSPVFERGGALDGPNLRDVPPRAWDALVVEQGGPDDVAAAAATGSLDVTAAVVSGRRPSNLSGWVRRDLSDLRRRVRNRSVEVRRGGVATREAAPAARLADALRERRGRLLDANETYDGAADRARVAVRAAFLDRLLARLDARAAEADVLDDGIASAVDGAGTGVDGGVATVRDRADRDRPRPSLVGGGPPTGAVRLVPDGSPGYLTLGPVDDRTVPAVEDDGSYRPLVARNVNVFSVPYGDVADAAVAAVFDQSDGARLRSAARALVAANRTLAARPNASGLRARRTRLHRAVVSSLAGVDDRTLTVLRSVDVPPAARRDAVEATRRRWAGTGRRALAATNGSYARVVAAAAAAESNVSRRRLRARLHVALVRERRETSTRVTDPFVNETAVRAESLARRATAEFVGRHVDDATDVPEDRWFSAVTAGTPAGLPVAPAPGYWYATVNVWTVEVRGAYARFVVRSPRGGPDAVGDRTRYVRDGGVVAVDVDEDGRPERLGRDDPVDFATGTVVAVAVPPGRAGVGDVDGNSDERSTGWPWPGCRDGGRQCLEAGGPPAE